MSAHDDLPAGQFFGPAWRSGDAVRNGINVLIVDAAPRQATASSFRHASNPKSPLTRPSPARHPSTRRGDFAFWTVVRCLLVRHGTAAPSPDDRVRPAHAGRACRGRGDGASPRGPRGGGGRDPPLGPRGRARPRRSWAEPRPREASGGRPVSRPEDAPDAAAAELEQGAGAPHAGGPSAPPGARGRRARRRRGARPIHFTPATAVGLRRGPAGGWELELIVPPRGGAAPGPIWSASGAAPRRRSAPPSRAGVPAPGSRGPRSRSSTTTRRSRPPAPSRRGRRARAGSGGSGSSCRRRRTRRS